MSYENYVRSHQKYQNALIEATEWLTLMKERLSMCSDTTGDRHTLQNRLERLQVNTVRVESRKICVKQIKFYVDSHKTIKARFQKEKCVTQVSFLLKCSL